jgi:photosystem II stability/assembly factor-like uncharacterized protein
MAVRIQIEPTGRPPEKRLFGRTLLRTLAAALAAGLLVFGTLHAGPTKWPLHDDLLSVDFPDEGHGFACGRFGTILHTSDGGATWTSQKSGTDLTLTSIDFVDSKTGWAVGNEGTILHTRDGGQEWLKQESPVPYCHMGVCFVTDQKGWIASEDTHILYTEDGGKTWTVQFRDEGYILKSISFRDELHGWAVGEYGYIYHTETGGRDWKKQGGYFEIDDYTGALEAEGLLFEAVAVDQKTAWAVGIDGHVTRTDDGGGLWTEVATGAPATQLFTIAYDGADTIVVGGKGICLFSRDRGRTWEKARLEPHIEYSWLSGIAASGVSRFVAVGEDGAIYRSADAGLWQRVDY